MKRLFSKEVMIGVSVIIALLMIFFGIDYLKGINVFKASNYYYTSFSNVSGLSTSAPVSVNGYKVGEVREISIDYTNPGALNIEMSLDKDLRLPKGTKAVLVSGLLGTATVELRLANSNEYYGVGDKIEGVNDPGLMGAASEMLPSVAEIVPRVDSLLMAANQLATDPALKHSLQSLEVVMHNLEVSTAQLARVMNSVPSIASNASSTMVNVNEFSYELVGISKDLAEVSRKLKSVPVDSTMRNINGITAHLNDITASLNSDNSSLGLLMRDPSLYNNLNSSASHIDSILIDLQRQPKRYIPAIKLF